LWLSVESNKVLLCSTMIDSAYYASSVVVGGVADISLRSVGNAVYSAAEYTYSSFNAAKVEPAGSFEF